MDKPKPKAEIIVIRNKTILQIYTASRDAYNWVKQEGDAFGNLFLPNHHDHYFHLFVYPTYDAEEVETYLLSYLNQDGNA